MSKSAAILLSFALTVLSGSAALAQYQDPRQAGQADYNDDLDGIYARINETARRSVVPPPPVKDARAYEQFMQQTGANLTVERANAARLAEARQRDAATTGAYEQKRISELAAWERSQVNNGSSVRRSHRTYMTPNTYNNNENAYVYGGGPTAAQFQGIDGRARVGLSQSQDNTLNRQLESREAAAKRTQDMEDVAESLRDQVLSTQSSNKKFGLQGVGTNLYVRQYGKPDANLPPVHNAAARIVPMGMSDY